MGLLLGFASLHLMHVVAARACGERIVWWFAVAALCLSSVGIYLGRFQRLNSWDAVRRPHDIIDMVQSRLHDPFANATLLTVVIAFSVTLSLCYFALYTVVLPRLDLDRLRSRVWR